MPSSAPFVGLSHAMATRLVAKHGAAAPYRAQEEIDLAVRRADWLTIKAWTDIKEQIEKLLLYPSTPPKSAPR